MHYGPTWDRQVSIDILNQNFKYRLVKKFIYLTGYCWTEPLRTFEQNFWVSANHAKSTTELFRYMPKTETKLNATHAVRGIPCDAWEHDVEIEMDGVNRTYTLTHHFVKSDWNVLEEFTMGAKNSSSPRPLARLVVKHHNDSTVDSWDFVGMKPYVYEYKDFDPCNIFGRVRGCGCDVPFRNLTDPDVLTDVPSLPGIFEDWTATVEESSSMTRSATNHSFARQEIFSQSKKMMRIDWGSGVDRHTLIEDFANKVKYRYAMNATYPNGMCYKINGTDGSDDNYYMKDGELRSTEWLLGYRPLEETYVTGQHYVRGMPVDVWEHKVNFDDTAFKVWHAFADENWEVSSYYNRSSVGGVETTQKRPLTRIVLVKESDTDYMWTWDYVGMQPYVHNAADFDVCSLGCCEEDSQPMVTPAVTPAFPSTFKDWSAVINTVYMDEKFSTNRYERFSTTHKKVRFDTGFMDERNTMIADGGKNVYHVVRNSTYPKGFCYTDNSKTFWNKDGHRETRDFTTRELIKIEIRIGKKHKEYVPTAQMVRGMAVNAFVSEAKIRGEEYEVTYYFTKGSEWREMYEKYDKHSTGYVDTNHPKYAQGNEFLVRIELKSKEDGRTHYHDFIGYDPYTYVADDFNPCKVTDGVEGCGCDSILQDLCSLSEQEVAGLAAGLFFVGFFIATLLAVVYCKFKRWRKGRARTYAKYNDNGI